MVGSNARTSVKLLVAAVYFAIFLSCVLLLWRSLPEPLILTDGVSSSLAGGYAFPPRTLDDAKLLGTQLVATAQNQRLRVAVVFCVTYVFLQSFSIPGMLQFTARVCHVQALLC